LTPKGVILLIGGSMNKEDFITGVAGSFIAAVVGLTGANANLEEIVPIETANEKVESGTPSEIKAKYSNVTTLSDKELKTLLKAVGFNGQGLKMAWAVAKKESNGRPLAFNGNKDTGDHSFGIFQINMNGKLMEDRLEKFDLNSVSDLFNPVTNAEIAFYMTKGGKDWSSWTYLEGQRIKEFLNKYPTVS
jgi:hypothetical protein